MIFLSSLKIKLFTLPAVLIMSISCLDLMMIILFTYRFYYLSKHCLKWKCTVNGNDIVCSFIIVHKRHSLFVVNFDSVFNSLNSIVSSLE